MSLEHPVKPLATIVPATARWIRTATRRRTITLLLFVGLLAITGAAGVRVDWRAYALMGAWIGFGLVAGPWATRPHAFGKRLHRYALTIAADVLLLGAIYFVLDAAAWLGAIFFTQSALVASATLSRRWRIGIAALIIVVYAALVLYAVGAGSFVQSPVDLPGIRGNWRYAIGQITATVGFISILMLLQSQILAMIRDTEQRYMMVVQSAADMIVTFDENGQFDSVNPATVEQSGYTFEELKAVPSSALFPPEDWPKVLATRKRNEAGETVTMDLRYLRKSGEVRWVQATSTPYRSADQHNAVLVIARDITTSKRLSDELRAREEGFRLIQDSVNVGFFTIDTSERFTTFLGRYARENPERTTALLGRKASETQPAEVAPVIRAANARALAGEDVAFEFTMTPFGQDTPHFFQTHLSPIRDEQGAIVGAAGVWTDMTESVTADRERDALRARVASAERMESLGNLVSGVAHELNNPLAAILNFTEDLLADKRPDEERIALEVIQAQALRSRTIVRDLLTFVRKGDRRQLKPATPGPILQTLVRGARPGLATQGVLFDDSIADVDTPLLLDRAGFEQVVTNLVTNAAQAAGAGGAVRLVARRDREAYVVVVEDNGAGIREEDFARIFEPFFTTKPTGQGVGLGLSVSLSIVEALGGTLHGENRSARSGGGARFTMKLPVATTAEGQSRAGAPAAVAAQAPIHEGPSNPMPPRLPSLLIIDDETAIRRALRRYFERKGWAVDEAHDGTAALVKLLRRDALVLYDVVLCDLKMPGVSGPELYRRLEAESPGMVRRLILSTGDVSAPDVADFLATVTVPVLEKPFELSALEKLAEQVRRETGEDRRARGSAVAPA